MGYLPSQLVQEIFPSTVPSLKILKFLQTFFPLKGEYFIIWFATFSKAKLPPTSLGSTPREYQRTSKKKNKTRGQLMFVCESKGSIYYSTTLEIIQKNTGEHGPFLCKSPGFFLEIFQHAIFPNDENPSHLLVVLRTRESILKGSGVLWVVELVVPWWKLKMQENPSPNGWTSKWTHRIFTTEIEMR